MPATYRLPAQMLWAPASCGDGEWENPGQLGVWQSEGCGELTDSGAAPASQMNREKNQRGSGFHS